MVGMWPVLIAWGPIVISSFGFFIALAFLLGVYLVWKLSCVYELESEKVLDLLLLTFFGGLIGSRLVFIALNFSSFVSWDQYFLINRYPGLSFWGALVGGGVTIWYFSGRLRLPFWQLLDLIAVGLVAGTILGDFGCLLGGCAYGIPSNWPIALPVVGLIEKRLPIMILELLILIVVLPNLYKLAKHFHFPGQVASWALILLGLTRIVTGFFRGDGTILLGRLTFNELFALLTLILGITSYYLLSQRSLVGDLKALYLVVINSRKRDEWLTKAKRNWYNRLSNLRYQISKFEVKSGIILRRLKRRLNVKSTPKEFR